jgi:hypothetical protein
MMFRVDGCNERVRKGIASGACARKMNAREGFLGPLRFLRQLLRTKSTVSKRVEIWVDGPIQPR